MSPVSTTSYGGGAPLRTHQLNTHQAQPTGLETGHGGKTPDTLSVRGTAAVNIVTRISDVAVRRDEKTLIPIKREFFIHVHALN